MGEANDVTSQRAPKENFGAGDIKEDVVRSLSLARQVFRDPPLIRTTCICVPFSCPRSSAQQNSVKEVLQQIPTDAVRWGAAGLIPYAGTSAAIAYFARQVYIATELGGAVGSQRFLL